MVQEISSLEGTSAASAVHQMQITIAKLLEVMQNYKCNGGKIIGLITERVPFKPSVNCSIIP